MNREEAETRLDQSLGQSVTIAAPADFPVESAASSAAEIVRSLQTLLALSPKSDDGAEATETQEHFDELLQLYDLGLPTLARSLEQSDRLSALLLNLLDQSGLPASERQFAEAVHAQLASLLTRQNLIFEEEAAWNAHSSRVQSLKDQATAAAAPLIELPEKEQNLKDQASALRQRIIFLENQLAEARGQLSRIEDEQASLPSPVSLRSNALSAQEQLSNIYKLHPVMKRRKHTAELAQANLQAEWESLRHFLS